LRTNQSVGNKLAQACESELTQAAACMLVTEFQIKLHTPDEPERSLIVQEDTVVVREPTPDMAFEFSKQEVESKELRPHGLDPSVIMEDVEYAMALKVMNLIAGHVLEFFHQSKDPPSDPGGPNMHIEVPWVREQEVESKELRPPGFEPYIILSDRLQRPKDPPEVQSGPRVCIHNIWVPERACAETKRWQLEPLHVVRAPAAEQPIDPGTGLEVKSEGNSNYEPPLGRVGDLPAGVGPSVAWVRAESTPAHKTLHHPRIQPLQRYLIQAWTKFMQFRFMLESRSMRGVLPPRVQSHMMNPNDSCATTFIIYVDSSPQDLCIRGYREGPR
jgi:hypothetical protein